MWTIPGQTNKDIESIVTDHDYKQFPGGHYPVDWAPTVDMYIRMRGLIEFQPEWITVRVRWVNIIDHVRRMEKESNFVSKRGSEEAHLHQ